VIARTAAEAAVAVWRRVAQKARKKEERRRRKAGEKGEEEGEEKEMEENGGCEAAVKRGRVRESGQAS